MISVNVYSPEALTRVQSDAVMFGLQMVGEHLGGVSIRGVDVLPLPSVGGLVQSSRVGYEKVDPYTDVHLFVAPTTDQGAGWAFMNKGVAWVNLAKDESRVHLHITTAHEVSHAVGFIRPGAKHEDKASPGHCGCPNCIMVPRPTAELRSGWVATKTTEDIRRHGNRKAVDHLALQQQTFCGDCVLDMQKFGNENLASLRTKRIREKRVMSNMALREFNKKEGKLS